MILSFKHKGLANFFFSLGSTAGIMVEHQKKLRLV